MPHAPLPDDEPNRRLVMSRRNSSGSDRSLASMSVWRRHLLPHARKVIEMSNSELLASLASLVAAEQTKATASPAPTDASAQPAPVQAAPAPITAETLAAALSSIMGQNAPPAPSPTPSVVRQPAPTHPAPAATNPLEPPQSIFDWSADQMNAYVRSKGANPADPYSAAYRRVAREMRNRLLADGSNVRIIGPK